MATVLCIQASPMGTLSFSVRAAQAFLASYREAHPADTVRTLDLATAAIPAFDFAAASGKYRIMHGQPHTPEEAKAWRAVEEAVRDFKAADKYVLASPMWNFGIPYRLKQYIDVLVQPGLTFSYTPGEGYKGLVTGRPAVLILARGGSYTEGNPAQTMDFQRPYLEAVLRFIGFERIETILVEPTLAGGPDGAASALAAAEAAARRMAKAF